MWTIALQRRRLKTDEPEDGDFLFRKWSDFQFLIVSLTRIRRAAILAAKVPEISRAMRNALSDFDAALPNLKSMRDVAEHFDDYAMDRGRNSAIGRSSLEVGIIGDTVFQWLGFELDADSALSTARQLFKAIQQAKEHIPAER